MSDNFNPYHKWLGIPENQQPPDHYCLLGIERFEEDPEVIAHAADQRMGHIKSFQAGPHAHFSQIILNEVAIGRACLLNPVSKAAYDLELRGMKLRGMQDPKRPEWLTSANAQPSTFPEPPPKITGEPFQGNPPPFNAPAGQQGAEAGPIDIPNFNALPEQRQTETGSIDIPSFDLPGKEKPIETVPFGVPDVHGPTEQQPGESFDIPPFNAPAGQQGAEAASVDIPNYSENRDATFPTAARPKKKNRNEVLITFVGHIIAPLLGLLIGYFILRQLGVW